MKRKLKGLTVLICMMLVFLVLGNSLNVHADDNIITGVTISGIDVSGMTREEAATAVSQYVESILSNEVTFIVGQGERVSTSLGELGMTWSNTDVIDMAFSVGNEGNVVTRYKTIKDVQVNGKDFELEVSFNDEAVRAFLEQCSVYDIEVQNATLKRENGEFVVVGGNPGEMLDVEASVEFIQNELFADYQAGLSEVPLIINTVEPNGTKEELSQITDLLGTFTTSYSSSGSNRSKNVENGCSLINGSVIFPGEEFSVYDTVKPFTEDNGYYLAGSYLNGQVVDSVGGGICQVSTTLYNAVLRSELEIVERHNHSMVVTYVQKSGDAAIAESSGKDFKFVNNTEYPIYIEGYTESKNITFNVYGVETRPSNRTLEFESKILSETVPNTDVITADPGQPIGYISTSSAHIGYTAELWKVVYVDGEEVERVQINSSRYSPSPKTAIVGVATTNSAYYDYIMAAIASGSIDTCKAAAAQIKAAEAQPQPVPQPEAQPEAQPQPVPQG